MRAPFASRPIEAAGVQHDWVLATIGRTDVRRMAFAKVLAAVSPGASILPRTARRFDRRARRRSTLGSAEVPHSSLAAEGRTCVYTRRLWPRAVRGVRRWCRNSIAAVARVCVCGTRTQLKRIRSEHGECRLSFTPPSSHAMGHLAARLWMMSPTDLARGATPQTLRRREWLDS